MIASVSHMVSSWLLVKPPESSQPDGMYDNGHGMTMALEIASVPQARCLIMDTPSEGP